MNEGFADIGEGLRQYELWRLLAWREVQRTNVRSRIGVFWHSVTFFIVGAGIAFLYADIFGQPAEIYVPFISAGLLAWNFINAPLGEGISLLLRNRGMITQIRTPIALYVFQFVCKHVYLLGLGLIGYAAVVAVFGLAPVPRLFDLICAMAIYTVASFSATLVLSIAAVFHEWLANLIPAVMRLAFFVTPVLWMPQMILDGAEQGRHLSLADELRQAAVLFNPLHHYLEIFRGPLIGHPAPALSWGVTSALAMLLALAALLVLSRMKQRVLVNL